MRRNRNAERSGPSAAKAVLAGGVATLAVASLLEALHRAVLDLSQNVQGLWTSGKLLAQNTQAILLLPRGAEALNRLSQERQEKPPQ